MSTLCSVYFVVSGFPTHPEDVEVPGTYRMEMDAALSPETQAMAALYAFHDNVPVKKDVDFSFLALDEHGNELEECMPWDIPACYRIDAPRDAAPRVSLWRKAEPGEAPTPNLPQP